MRNAATNTMIAGFVFGSGITYHGGVYTQVFNPAAYGLSPGTPLKFQVYFGSKLVATWGVTLN